MEEGCRLELEEDEGDASVGTQEEGRGVLALN